MTYNEWYEHFRAEGYQHDYATRLADKAWRVDQAENGTN
jgi:hypothetical protein